MDPEERSEIASTVTSFKPLFTAGEAYPAFERLVLNARQSVVGCFRVFDPLTTLRSPEAKEHGDTWFDLILTKLNDGVSFDITITDFDPVVATDHHRASWRSARVLAALDVLSERGLMSFDIAMHPARVGLLPQLALQPKIQAELQEKESDELTPGLEEAKASIPVPLVPATHHQKLAMVDDEWLYIGGLDLNDRRYDTSNHEQPAEETWQDINCIVSGPVVQSASRHLRSFKGICAGDEEPSPREPGFLRTVSKARLLPVARISPKPVITEIEAAHLDAIARCDGLIYLETQFFRHAPLAEALAKRAVQCDSLGGVLVLPAAPEDVAFEGNDREDAQLGAQKQLEALEILREGLGPRLAIVAPARPVETTVPGPGALFDAPIIYVHSKLSLFGSDEAILSSANLNGRSMRWDTEAGLLLTDREIVSDLRQRAFKHWFGTFAPDLSGPAPQIVEWVAGAAAENMVTAPAERKHFLLPYPFGRDAALASPLPGVPDEMV
ncbi:hypothetical protein [Tropicimonas sp. S265A]|uniref:hypothetical protein n=1 Tax=Tropicimonas sp. S265A TaxID=3415134 RepID=UPI003C7C9BED